MQGYAELFLWWFVLVGIPLILVLGVVFGLWYALARIFGSPVGKSTCARCGRNRVPDDGQWHAEHPYGSSELLVFCPECWQREFGSSG